MGPGFGHHLAVRADFRGGGLPAGRTGMEAFLIPFGNFPVRFLLFGLTIQKGQVKGMLGSRRFGFQAIQGVFVSQHLGAFGHGAFIHDVIDVMDDRIGRDFPLGQAIQGLDLPGESAE